MVGVAVVELATLLRMLPALQDRPDRTMAPTMPTMPKELLDRHLAPTVPKEGQQDRTLVPTMPKEFSDRMLAPMVPPHRQKNQPVSFRLMLFQNLAVNIFGVMVSIHVTTDLYRPTWMWYMYLQLLVEWVVRSVHVTKSWTLILRCWKKLPWFDLDHKFCIFSVELWSTVVSRFNNFGL